MMACLPPPFPYGLYTCARNAVYVPETLLPPTDPAGLVRVLPQRRTHQLYGALCDVVPRPARVRPKPRAEWGTASFTWAEPVSDESDVASFLEFWLGRMAALLPADASSGAMRDQ